MNIELKHARRTVTTPQSDGSQIIVTEGYYEELNSVKEEIQKSILTTKDTFIKDLMEAVGVVTRRESRDLTLKIEADKDGNPIRIVKTWTTRKEYYGR